MAAQKGLRRRGERGDPVSILLKCVAGKKKEKRRGFMKNMIKSIRNLEIPLFKPFTQRPDSYRSEE